MKQTLVPMFSDPPRATSTVPVIRDRFGPDIREDAARYLRQVADSTPPVSDVTLPEISFESITFLSLIHRSPSSDIFKVEFEGTECTLKLYHDNGDPGYGEYNGRDLSRFRCESSAYRNFKAYNIDSTGLVPYCYGIVRSIPRKDFSPFLDEFQEDLYDPTGLLLEYLPNCEELSAANYTDALLPTIVRAFETIHNALVEHADPFSRNVVITQREDGSKRVVLIDFDVAKVYPNVAAMTDDDAAFMALELMIVKGFVQLVSNDSNLKLARWLI